MRKLKTHESQDIAFAQNLHRMKIVCDCINIMYKNDGDEILNKRKLY